MEEQAQMARSRAQQPCAACKTLRRRCDADCLLLPYFPMEEIAEFAGVHKIFGASNVVKMIQMVDEGNREDAVKAMVYEATARLRDPVYGSAGTVLRLQKMVEDLRSQLDTTTAQISELHAYNDRLLEDVLFHHEHSNPNFSQDMGFVHNYDFDDHLSFLYSE